MFFLKKHLYQIAIIFVLILLAWHKIFFQTPMGEGFFYFSHGLAEINFPSVRYDTGARMACDIFKFFFQDNLQFFQVFIVMIILLSSALFYWLIYETTNNKIISLIASIIFGVNFIGNYEMFAIGNYQFVVQRPLWFLLLFPSFTFFVKYVKQKKEKFFIISLFLYTLSIYFAQFSIFFLPIFFTYYIGYLLDKKGSFKRFLILGLRVFLYFFITFIILHTDTHSFAKNNSFFAFLTGSQNMIINQFLRQLSALIIPEQIMHLIALKKGIPLNSIYNFFYLPSLFLYISLGIYLFKKERKFRALVVALFLFIPIVSILNSFMRADLIASIESGSRYLYVSMVAVSIIWAILFYSFFSSTKVLIKIIAIFFVILFIYNQIIEIWNEMNVDFYKYKAVKISLNYIKRLSPEITNDAFVVVPSMLSSHGADFSMQFYGKTGTSFYPFQASWHKQMKRSFDPKKDYILEYDKQTEKVIDLTKNYQEIIITKQKEDP